MKIGQAISMIRNDFKLVHADSRITNKYIYSLIQKHASWIIRQDSEKNKLIKLDSIWQTLKCMELIDVPTTDGCCKFTSKCKILRTADKIPSMYEDSFGSLIRSVNSVDISQELQPIKYSEWTRKINNPDMKYNKTLYYFYKDGYLYFPNMTWKTVTVTGYFKEDVSKHNACGFMSKEEAKSINCMSILDSEWKIPPHMESRVVDFVLKEISATFTKANPNQEVNINKKPIYGQ